MVFLRGGSGCGRAWLTFCSIGLLLLGLTGCSTGEALLDQPVTWWHDMEGGAIAQNRPPPPAANEPYPNLATVPSQPPATQSLEAWQALSQRLRREQEEANALPSEAPPETFDSSGAFHPEPSTPTATASLRAATPSSPAPTVHEPETKRTGKVLVSSGLPTLAMAAPPPPRIPGVVLPGLREVALRKPVPTLLKTPVKPTESPREPPLAIAFPPRSAILPFTMEQALKTFAANRGARMVAVAGFGDAGHQGLKAQAAALKLALARARAMAAVLIAAGVPPDALRLNAGPKGRGGMTWLLN